MGHHSSEMQFHERTIFCGPLPPLERRLVLSVLPRSVPWLRNARGPFARFDELGTKSIKPGLTRFGGRQTDRKRAAHSRAAKKGCGSEEYQQLGSRFLRVARPVGDQLFVG